MNKLSDKQTKNTWIHIQDFKVSFLTIGIFPWISIKEIF